MCFRVDVAGNGVAEGTHLRVTCHVSFISWRVHMMMRQHVP